MKDWIFSFMEEFGYIGIMLVIALENLFPPIPSEIVLPFGGFMTTRTELTVAGVVIASTIGSVLGAVILYLVGRLVNVDKLEKFVDRWGHLLRVSRKDIRSAEGWFIRYGNWTVFFCRLIPVVRSLISIPAGMAKMNFTTFILYSTMGTVVWNTILVSLGAFLGESWEDILGYVELYKDIFYVLFVVAGLVFIIWYLKRKRKSY
ncbi:membrane protein DedA, SNARE-associated domain [Mesobacillus persicus]|uniref:Membrane protein DedA, SNARE-associated domain n=1 Tax=Mesobacillus persicus TaxID=930146 RepID=A0A1H7ZMI8_9BACI|nr:DedA family protein [Mesobacillus persicus]SEM59600.1 membrane protein DedA, SNARE-associated domain [Mesobacillus persicus]